MGLLKGVTVFIGWLSGSLAGIGALLYACGYLVTFAHLNLLGIDHLLAASNERFIQQGARFLAVTGELLTRKLLGLLAVFLLLAIVPVTVYVVLSRFRPDALGRMKNTWGAAKARVTALHQHLPWSADVSLYLVLLVLLFSYLLSYLPEFIPPLTLSDLLYTDVDAGASGRSLKEKLRCWLLTADSGHLRSHFSALLDAELLAIAFAALAWHVTRRRSQRLLMVMPFLAVFVLYTVYLPMLYGVLVHPTNYNGITFPGAERIEQPATSSFFLLQKTNDDFLVWDSARKTVLWIPKTDVKSAEIGPGTALFKREGSCGG
jgi:hypothetical protein